MATTRRSRSAGTPPPPRGQARQRMIDGAIDSLRVHGASATSVDRVLAATGAPRGSVYHHFPGGRTELITDALSTAGDLMSAYIERLTSDDEPTAALDRFAAMWRHTLLDSDFRAGCPIFAVAVETNDETPEFARLAAEVFDRWQQALTGMLTRHAVPAERAARLATLTVAAFEGAIALCRVHRDITPLDDAVDGLRELMPATH
ncbi:TetR/AcrR family transcriptional regulator [Nocardia barduliensis]|uniref:TetR/AcrR family transcriptional regulator n=1 Tax=Nocardia barduliensis TaxID=2736643 RepID=UPI001FE7956C|nr:TetR/AcrR family transcriptional regulator [Nocardia barduliensis]